jgi:2-succinyl-5-enolpyruvyl-6-hydroxy-3-cyclohexene-1-carboxylate synthase
MTAEDLILAAGGFLVGNPDWLARHRPDVVLQIGATPTTRASQSLVASAGEVVILDADHPDPDPEGRATRRIPQAPEAFAATAWDLFADARPSPPDGWADAWRSADLLARAAADRLLDAWDEPFEGRIARDVAAFVPKGGGLFVGSSAPVRDLDAYMTPRRPPRVWTTADLVRFVANRGASGIDGSISTALGVAAAHPGTYALLGDLAFIYDAGALLWSARRGVDAVLVVIRNGGGHIFSLLPQRALPEHRDLFVTPHDLDLATICAAAGAPHESVEHAGDVQPALERAAQAAGVAVVEVVVDPDLNRARRDEVRDATRAALARAG